MPLVVPGVMTGSSDKADEWMQKLMGKTLSDDTSNETCFCKKDLPEQCRVIKPGQMVTKDHKPDRLNIQVKEDGTVEHVHYG
ncbi:hypothetical protein jhhlp_006771 [Lomentospora prolificans]|uniref:Proteinase inhibitor I78 n=1 Tax=Lomentospora prolificans TaxID=41688 RepID=A0A2N3N2P8_9PEZI|nr:hypothetical protein jhhlp_006771 [Lomentospora prolificans]